MARSSKSSELDPLIRSVSELETAESRVDEFGTKVNKSDTTQNSSGTKNKKKKKGLSPPPISPVIPIDTPETPTENCDADKTQWEYTRFKDEAEGKFVTDPNAVNKNLVAEGMPLVVEEKQIMRKKGEHLLEKPKFLLIVLALEGLMCAIAMGVFLGAGDNPPAPTSLTVANLIITLLVIVAVFTVELLRTHVKEVEYMKGEVRYIIPYNLRYSLVVAHLLRLFLTCADITMSALDHSFDAGTITVLALQPVVLLLQIGHVIFGIRPRRDA